MSQWTHVNAAIRFDGIKGVTPDPVLGNTFEFEDSEEQWDACDVPRGSEGSLQYELVEVGTGLRRFEAHIWGDLRDYSDVHKIEAYLNRIVAGQLIRSGIAEIDVENGETKVLRYVRADSEDWGSWQVIYKEDV